MLKAKRKIVWKYLLDPKVLEKIIPGVKKVKKKGKVYKSKINLNFGFVKGGYKGQFKLKKKKKPKSMLLVVEGSSKSNSISAKAYIKLRKTKTGTIVSFETKPQISGGLSLFGGRIIQSVASKIASQFFINLEKQILKSEQD